MRICTWHPEPLGDTLGPAFATHVHGRNLGVRADPSAHGWRWQVRAPHGALLADGMAPTLAAAEEAAENEATAVHPPSEWLLELLLD